MLERSLGRTGLSVSRVGLGLAALGRPGYINLGHSEDLAGRREIDALREQTHAVLDEALAFGVRYFDTARSYGRGEEFLGAWLRRREIPAHALTVASKWGYTYTAEWAVEAEVHEVKDHTLPTLRRQIQESRRNLGEALDVYQIHSATIESGVLEDAEVLDELARLRDGGLRIGISVSGPRQPETIGRALTARRGGEMLFSTVQATWNLLERSAGAALGEAHAAGVGVIVKEALANGRLTERNRRPECAARIAVLRAAARRCHVTPDALALAAVLAQPWADVVLSGAATREQLRSNLGAVAIEWGADLEAELGAIATAPQEYWAIRSRLTWN